LTQRTSEGSDGAEGGDSNPDGWGHQGTESGALGWANVLGAGALGALPDGEGHGIALAQRVERGAGARRVVEEVFGAFGRGDEAEALVGESLDGAVC